MVVPQEVEIELKSRPIKTKIIFKCINCVRKENPATLRPKGCELMAVYRGKCPFCGNGEIESTSPTLMVYRQLVQDGFCDEDMIFLKAQVKKIISEKNE